MSKMALTVLTAFGLVQTGNLQNCQPPARAKPQSHKVLKSGSYRTPAPTLCSRLRSRQAPRTSRFWFLAKLQLLRKFPANGWKYEEFVYSRCHFDSPRSTLSVSGLKRLEFRNVHRAPAIPPVLPRLARSTSIPSQVAFDPLLLLLLLLR